MTQTLLGVGRFTRGTLTQEKNLSLGISCVSISAIGNGTPDFEDVQAFEHIAEVCKHFANERENFTYAYRFVRGGEEYDDYEEECYGSETELSQMMVERLTEEIFVRMTWELKDDLEQSTTRQDPSSLGLGNIGTDTVPQQTKEI
jgi:hypothetical protein